MELTHIHPGLPVCPWKDALSCLSVSNVPPPVVPSSSLSSQKVLYMSTPLPPHCVPSPALFSFFFFRCVPGDGIQSLTHPRQEFWDLSLIPPRIPTSPSPLVSYFHISVFFLKPPATSSFLLSLFSQPHPRPTFPRPLFSPLTTCPAPVFLP